MNCHIFGFLMSRLLVVLELQLFSVINGMLLLKESVSHGYPRKIKTPIESRCPQKSKPLFFYLTFPIFGLFFLLFHSNDQTNHLLFSCHSSYQPIILSFLDYKIYDLESKHTITILFHLNLVTHHFSIIHGFFYPPKIKDWNSQKIKEFMI